MGRRLAPLPARPRPVRQANRRPLGPGRPTGPDPDRAVAQTQDQTAIPLMDLAFIEYHPQRVLDAFRQGEFDALEILGQADERDFFERCFKERLLLQLAQDLPTLRKKEEVPRWFILAANLSLKLHPENSFLAFERVVRCGGCYVYAGALVVPGNAHEVGPFYDELPAR